MNFVFPVLDKAAFVSDCVWMRGSFSSVNRKENKEIPISFFIHFLLLMMIQEHPQQQHQNTTTTTTTTYRATHKTQAYTQGRDMTRVTHSSFSCRDKWKRLLHWKAQQQLCMGSFVFAVCVSSISRLCTQGSSSLQSCFSSVLCALCARACCSFEPVQAVRRRWVWLYSLCVGDDEWGE